ncbi:unnamed protein product [Durusdinium trenchii]|uniref:Uncharacterized protein n=1 Tax=Durusdinium trenchii TaxID=1381693 RepID=A0ABP0NQY1_9DINO
MLLPNAVEEVATNSSFRGETSSFDHILPEKKPKDDSQELEKQEKQQRQERRQRKRQEMKDMKQRRLAHFLKTYGFSTDVNEPRVEAACSPDSLQRNTFKEVLFRCHRLVGREESIYPIHAAAELGDIKLLRSLLAAGADPQQRRAWFG